MREGVRAVALSLGILVLTAIAQGVVFVVTESVALLSDLVHNLGDALTAVPVGAAFLMRSKRAERWSAVGVVLAIFISACFALVASIDRLIDPRPLERLGTVAAAGVIGFVGNEIAAVIRKRAGERIGSAALVADGDHARADGLVSLGVVLSAGAVAAGAPVADPVIGLAIALFIFRITWHAWRTVRD